MLAAEIESNCAYLRAKLAKVELTNREIKLILQKAVNKSRKNWSTKIDDPVWAYRISYKTPRGMSPFKMVSGKACHLPIELVHKSY